MKGQEHAEISILVPDVENTSGTQLETSAKE